MADHLSQCALREMAGSVAGHDVSLLAKRGNLPVRIDGDCFAALAMTGGQGDRGTGERDDARTPIQLDSETLQNGSPPITVVRCISRRRGSA